MMKPENAQDAEELTSYLAYYAAWTPDEYEAERLEDQADMCSENPQRVGMTQAEGDANAVLLRREANDLRRLAVMRAPVRVIRRPNVRRPRARVRRAVRRRARAPSRPGSADGSAEHVGPATAVKP